MEMKESPYRGKKGIAIVLAIFLLLAFAGSVINPLYEATDELRHYRYVQHIVQLKRLPVQGEMACQAQGHHPPLFYLLGAAATFWIDTGKEICSQPQTNPFWQYRYWEVGTDNKNQYLHGPEEAFPWYGEALAAHIVRGINVLLGAGVVLLTWVMGRAIWPKRPSIALGGAAFVAFNPMFVYMSGAIHNDVLAALSGTAVTLACVLLVKDEKGLSRRWGVAFGLLFSLALMSKFNLAAVAVLVAIAVTWTAWRKKQWRLWLEVVLIIGGITLLLTGWWFARNQILYGEPTGFQRLTEIWGRRDPRESWGTAVFELPYTWTSLWGRFGYGQIPLPDGIYLGLRWLVGLGLLGLLVPLLRRDWGEVKAVGAPVGILILDVLLFFAVLFNYLLVSPAGAMGRFFFPALAALALLTFYGWSQWLNWLALAIRHHPATNRQIGWLAAAVNAGMIGLTIVALFGYLKPAYARPPSFGADTAVPHEINAQFDGFVKLRGYELSTDTLRPGEYVTAKLYWEVTGQPPGDYLLFLHLIDSTDTMVAQRDTYPGLGNFPSSQWRPGDRFVETIRLHTPETMYTPETAVLSTGFYAAGPDVYRLGVTAADGSGLGDALPLAEMRLKPANDLRDDVPNPLNQTYENQMRLVGYEYNTRQPRPGDDLAVTLYWETLADIAGEYEAEVGLCDDPCPGWRPPRQTAVTPIPPLTAGQVVSTAVAIPLDPAISPGSYLIHVSLIDPVDNKYQNIIGEDGHYIDDRLLLARVRVQP
ncbi:MAG TPA: phospholipid carrier-dependent glycosyltransferase [Anaerolineae bacterium]|nr:phospholipid carrier-dependent glycosyltransferase [Anaerolineae bacterium]